MYNAKGIANTLHLDMLMICVAMHWTWCAVNDVHEINHNNRWIWWLHSFHLINWAYITLMLCLCIHPSCQLLAVLVCFNWILYSTIDKGYMIFLSMHIIWSINYTINLYIANNITNCFTICDTDASHVHSLRMIDVCWINIRFSAQVYV